jgi:glutamate N-acetyltransferase/amino-acid N-acetyltransferase
MDTEKHMIRGFRASATSAGLKKDRGLDLALIVSDRECAAAGVFTTNKVKAAPVILSHEHLAGGTARAVISNAGNANACTGEAGLRDARRTAELVARELEIAPEEVLVASTGVIGKALNMEVIEKTIPGLVNALSPEGIPLAARAIMTTDSFPKVTYFEGEVDGGPYRILGIAKGAGMIMPQMATMLCFVLTDILIDADDLRDALVSSTEMTFNRITVDGDTSTNDTVLALANGLAGNKTLSQRECRGFTKGLEKVMGELARMIVQDGEGATKLVNVTVKGAANGSDALRAARAVANSSLVKTAFFGQDPNWGRIMAALGRAGIEMEEGTVDIWIDGVQIVEKGLGKGVEAEEEAAGRMALREFMLEIDLHQGTFEDQIITCDLTHDYIRINADYRT